MWKKLFGRRTEALPKKKKEVKRSPVVVKKKKKFEPVLKDKKKRSTKKKKSLRKNSKRSKKRSSVRKTRSSAKFSTLRRRALPADFASNVLDLECDLEKDIVDISTVNNLLALYAVTHSTTLHLESCVFLSDLV